MRTWKKMDKKQPQDGYHIPVLYNESIQALNIQSNGIYVDCTFGGGGHSSGILERLGPEGRLIAFDQDADALANIPDDSRLIFVPENFKHLAAFLKLHRIEKVDGILADLGVSSHQFDEGSRGFSTRFNGPLDMRMDTRQTNTAASIVNDYSEAALHKLFEQYGEVSNSKTLARHIVQHRKAAAVSTIESFKELIAPVVKGNPAKYLAQVFQALRIEVNDEMEALKAMLQQASGVLKTGGRIAVITFHSLEDKIVKQFFKTESFEEAVDHPFFNVSRQQSLKPVNKKPIVASEDEVRKNSRSRSAKLRIAEKL